MNSSSANCLAARIVFDGDGLCYHFVKHFHSQTQLNVAVVRPCIIFGLPFLERDMVWFR